MSTSPSRPPRHPTLMLIWKAISISTGVALILFGIVGLFLPILQGWLMILAGLAILSPYSPTARWVMDWLRQKLRLRPRQSAPATGASSTVTGTTRAVREDGREER